MKRREFLTFLGGAAALGASPLRDRPAAYRRRRRRWLRNRLIENSPHLVRELRWSERLLKEVCGEISSRVVEDLVPREPGHVQHGKVGSALGHSLGDIDAVMTARRFGSA